MTRLCSKEANTNDFRSVSSMAIIVFFAVLISACSKDDDQAAPKQDNPVSKITEISQDIKDLIYFKGNEKATRVVVNVQEGPDTVLDSLIVNLISETYDTSDLLAVNVHQAQSLDSTIVLDTDITLNQAIDFSGESIEILDKVIAYFKDQDRTVFVLGNSFGAFVTQELIAKKGIDRADKYLIMTGRLDINEVMWQALAEGKIGGFVDGVTPVLDEEPEASAKDRNLNRITAALGMNRYTQLLDPIEDLSDITYVYGAMDEAVGGLTGAEVSFLESKNANILMGTGGHGDTFWEFVEQGFKETFDIETPN